MIERLLADGKLAVSSYYFEYRHDETLFSSLELLLRLKSLRPVGLTFSLRFPRSMPLILFFWLKDEYFVLLELHTLDTSSIGS